jgi:hypothetical protein
MIRLEPRTPFLEPRTDTQLAYTAKHEAADTALLKSDPLSGIGIRDVVGVPPPIVAKKPRAVLTKGLPYGPVLSLDGDRLSLTAFPDYEFDSDGTPFRVRGAPKRGPLPKMGRVEPNAAGNFSLRNSEGVYVSMSRANLLRALAGKPSVRGRKVILPDFSKYWFDDTGHAFSARTNKPLTYHNFVANGAQHKRFRLWNDRQQSIVNVSDLAVRRMRDGRASYRAAEPMVGTKWMGAEFPDYAADEITGQPYRISSPRFFVAEPMCIAPKPDGRFNLLDWSGKRRTLSHHNILDLIRPNRTPNPESES